MTISVWSPLSLFLRRSCIVVRSCVSQEYPALNEGVDRGGRGYGDRGCGIGGRGCGIGGRGGGKRE